MQVGVILFDFAPDVHVAGLTLRLESIALAGTILLAVGLAAFIASRVSGRAPGPPSASNEADGREPLVSAEEARRRMPGFADAGSLGGTGTARAAGRPATRDGRGSGGARLSQVDLLIIVLSVVPGAIAGGRLGYVLIHLDYYASHQGAILDPGQGSLELGLAALGGTVTGLIVAYGLRAPIGRWLHVAAIPLLLGIALGKLAMALSGDGQGLPSNATWATAYSGPGPWGSLAPEVPSHPAQLYEGALTLLVLLALLVLFAAGRFRAQDGRAFVAAIYLWAVVRLAVAFFWRDPEVLGPLRAGQLIALVVALLSLLAWLVLPRLIGRAADRVHR